MFITRHDVKLPASTVEPPSANQSAHVTPHRNIASFGPFASLSSAVMTHLPQSGDKRKEQATGMEFPEECCVLTKKDCPVLTGFG